AAYGRSCRELLERFGGSEDPDVVRNILYWGLAVGDAGVEPQELLRMADRCLAGAERSKAWMVVTEGMAEYRAGRLERSVESLRKAEPLAESPLKAALHFMLSMAYQRLNRPEEAKAAYQQALRDVELEYGTPDRYQPEKGAWTHWLHSQVLRREAEAVLKQPAAVPKE